MVMDGWMSRRINASCEDEKIAGTRGVGALGEKALSSTEYTGLSLQEGWAFPVYFRSLRLCERITTSEKGCNVAMDSLY